MHLCTSYIYISYTYVYIYKSHFIGHKNSPRSQLLPRRLKASESPALFVLEAALASFSATCATSQSPWAFGRSNKHMAQVSTIKLYIRLC